MNNNKLSPPPLYKDEAMMEDDVYATEVDEATNEDNSVKEKIPYPKHVFFILGNEFCERYSFYGMKSLLTLYFVNKLEYSKDQATIIYHTFVAFAYFMPIIGSFISDQFLGKFKTIVYLSLVYILGHCIKSVASITSFSSIPHELTFIGLALIAIGTGGIKPCVAAFAGDQFVLPDQARQLQSFFSIFYMSINLGSLFSNIFGPMMRNVHCFGEEDCYPLAFGVPAALMIIATVIIVMGKRYYTIRPSDGVVTKSICIIGKGIKNIKCCKNSKSKHWLDPAKQKYGAKLVNDVKPLLGVKGVLILFVPLTFFWAIFDQSGIRWTLQANDMGGKLGGWKLLPEQMQFINPALILLLVPIFDKVIYPLLAKWNILVKPLQRMTAGVFISAVAFGISGVLDLHIQSNVEDSVHMLWQFPQYLVITIAEILVSITGLEFAYNQAPPSMKSIIQACWLLSIAFGNLIVTIQASIGGLDNRASEIFLFTGLMFLCAIIFTLLAWFFVPREARLETEDTEEGDNTELEGVGGDDMEMQKLD